MHEDLLGTTDFMQELTKDGCGKKEERNRPPDFERPDCVWLLPSQVEEALSSNV